MGAGFEWGLKVAGNDTQPGCAAIHATGSGAPWGTKMKGTRRQLDEVASFGGIARSARSC
jgi:hypothetical protein